MYVGIWLASEREIGMSNINRAVTCGSPVCNALDHSAIEAAPS